MQQDKSDDLIGAMTTAQAAASMNVSEKTINQWIREGLPTVRRGEQGGECSLIDPIELFLWKLKAAGRIRDESVMQWWKEQGAACDGNIVRWVVELYNKFALDRVLNRVFADWSADPKQYGRYGLSEKQAAAVAYQLWSMSALYMNTYLQERYEHDLKHETRGADLDGIATIMTGSRVESQFSDHSTITTPTNIFKLMPADIKRALTAKKS